MLGFLFTVIFALGSAGVGHAIARRWTQSLDPAAALGLQGLIGLGAMGTVTLFIGLLPGGLNWGIAVIAILAMLGLVWLFKNLPKGTAPKGPHGLAMLACTVLALISLVSVLAPSTTVDWDTLAYHLAVPKIWMAEGRIHFISFIHHSNFPAVVDDLYVWGIKWGGQAGAKAFSWCFAQLGVVALFGFARQRYGTNAGWLAAVAFSAIPVVVWEAGTAYVDVANGLFIGLGILLAARYVEETNQDDAVLAGILLGLGAASKYTGLQTVAIVSAALAGYAVLRKVGNLKAALTVAAVAVAISAPWYVKNIVQTGNPVYPFFYSVFHGKNWDEFGDRIYKNQQQTFGAGRPFEEGEPYTSKPLEPARLGSSVLGLAYVPGRYTDPQPTKGNGFPFVSLGAIPLIGLFVWAFSGRVKRYEGLVIGVALVSLLGWFFLSQQARYILGIMVPLTVLAGGAAATLAVRQLVAGAIALQTLATLFVSARYGDTLTEKLRVVLGAMPADEYQKQQVGFFEPAQDLNELAKGGRVALFDEVFGYFLDVPYFWANPGHTTELGYADMKTSDEFVAALKKQGITYAYANLGLALGGGEELQKWFSAAGLNGPVVPYADREARMSDEQVKYKVLLAEAVASGKINVSKTYGKSGTRIVFQIP